MTILKIQAFGGEVPRQPPRALPDGGAQRYQNLLATATELRPLAGDKVVGSSPAGAQSLHRLPRTSGGALRTDDASGWMADAADKNYVAGQLNDDATARTAVSWNDGTLPPRVIDALGANRLLGVPAPAKPTVTLARTTQFTRDDAEGWAVATLIPAMAAALRGALYENAQGSRIYGGAPVAGPNSMLGATHDTVTPWLGYYLVSQAAAADGGLNDLRLGGVPSGGWLQLRIELLPYWGTVRDRTSLEWSLRQILNPKDGSQLFPEARIAQIATDLMAQFDPNGASLRAKRSEMDAELKSFQDALNASITALPAKPTPPTKPTVPEWDTTGYGTGELASAPRRSEWVAYDAALKTYNDNLAAWQKSVDQREQDKASRMERMVSAQIASERLSNEIEAEYFKRKENIEAFVSDYVSTLGLIKPKDSTSSTGIVEVDADRIVDTRFYVATYVTDWGWESAPSPVSEMVEADQNDGVALAMVAPPGGRDITHWRLYRSNTGSQTSTFQFVTQQLASVVSYQDKVKSELLGEPCPTLTWAEPPTRVDSASPATIKPLKGPDPYLKGIVGMPNGIIAGFIDNFVAFCDPYHPYAWPVEYQITTETPIVGLGVFGQSLFVGTMGNPYIITGADSANMSAEKLDADQACMSRRSIASVGGGVVYASPDGLCMASPHGVQPLTGALFSREDWQALNPASIVGSTHEGVYYFFTAQGCFALDFLAKKLGRVQLSATALCKDVVTDHLYAVSGSQIVKLFAEGRRTATWKSGIAVMPAQAPLAWLQVDGDQTVAKPVTVRWYGDGELRYTASLTSITPVRLPPGRWLEHEVELETQARVTKVMLAGSTAELKQA